MKKFEYRIQCDVKFDELPELGEQGWELVAILPPQFVEGFGEVMKFYFKREMEQPNNFTGN